MIRDRSSAIQILTFGILMCPECGAHRIFRALSPCRHITDSQCEECGYSYGRADVREVVQTPRGGEVRVTRRPVIGDEAAAAAARRYLRATGTPGIMPPPPPIDVAEEAEPKSYAEGALAGLR